MINVHAGTSGFPPPRIAIDAQGGIWAMGRGALSSPETQQSQKDQLATINAGLAHKLESLRNGVDILAEQIKNKEQ